MPLTGPRIREVERWLRTCLFPTVPESCTLGKAHLGWIWGTGPQCTAHFFNNWKEHPVRHPSACRCNALPLFWLAEMNPGVTQESSLCSNGAHVCHVNYQASQNREYFNNAVACSKEFLSSTVNCGCSVPHRIWSLIYD